MMMKLLINLFFVSAFYFAVAQDKGSPYLAVMSENAVIPLKSSKTEVQISGTIAHVKLSQRYQNLGNQPIEAMYVFPLATQAAVHQMQMTIGDRIVNAKIFEREEAQKIYATALEQGKRTAKLAQDRPNVFQMKVANIIPEDEIVITIYYTELLVPVNGEYQFVAPAVVGPRFTGEHTASEESFHMPYTPKGIAATFDYDINVTLNAGMIIQTVGSSSHEVVVNQPDAKTAEILLSKEGQNPADRDFILNYNLRGKEIQAGLLLYEQEDENFFAFQIEPTKTTQLEKIPAREYLFIVDVSGSMNGYPLDVSKVLLRNLLCDLRATDTFNIQLFASSATVFSPAPLETTDENIEAAIRFLHQGQGGGGTQLLSALKHAYSLPRTNPGTARSMVIITDGYVSIEREAFELIRNNLDRANVFTFGIGSSVNRYLIEGMANVSNSESFIVTNMSEAPAVAQKFKDYISTPLLTQVKIEAVGFASYEVAPRSIPDVFAARPVVLYGKYHGKASGKLVITGYQGKQKFRQEYKVSQGRLSQANKALRYLWARKRIAELDDYRKLFDEDVRDSVVALGLQYNLVTNYTSFVAVDETIANDSGNLKKVKQPLPMPFRVNNSAVGAAAEVKEKTTFKKSFRVIFLEQLPRTEKRQLTLEFRAIFGSLVDKFLKDYGSLRVTFDPTGQITRVEQGDGKKWVLHKGLTADFKSYSKRRMNLSQETVLILKN